MTVTLDGASLDINEVIRVSRNGEEVVISAEAMEKVERSRDHLEKIILDDNPAYGIKTGFGELCNVSIPREDAMELQKNLVRSHAAGVGDPLPRDISRGIMLIRLNSLIKGHSGVSVDVVETLVAMLNKNVVPVIPSQGSVGSSGDLAPLAHMSLVLMGEGEVLSGEGARESVQDGGEAMSKAGIDTVDFHEKDGLALLNGTAPMCSILAHAIYDSYNLLGHALIASAMSLDALKGSVKPFDERIHEVRPHKGQSVIAGRMRNLLEGSGILAAHRDCSKVQDAYTLRCIPQVLGAVLDTLDYVEKVLAIEMNAATDNPLIFEGTSISGGNFHGEPIAFVSDFLSIVLAEVANFSERRIARLIDGRLSELPAFLVEEGGLNSGYMIAQYTAASLASENKSLAHPASVDSIPTSANQEDHVSMGTTASRKALQIARNVEKVVAIELLCAAQGLDFHDEASSPVIEKVQKAIRCSVPHYGKDRIVAKDIEKMCALMKSEYLMEIAGIRF